MFRKSGEQGWKAWVPVYNQVVLFRLGGLSGWLVLLYLVPVAGWVVMIIACHRIVGHDGVGGYSGGPPGEGIATKRWLLEHEGALTAALFS